MRNNQKVKMRESGFEMVRIIAMAMIVANHLINHGIMKVSGPDPYALWSGMSSINRIISAVTGCGGRIGVAVFFMLTGYFMAEREKISVPSVFNFLGKVHFFAAVMLCIFLLLRTSTGFGADFDLPSAVKKSLFIPATLWWFAFAYLVLMFLAPSINIFVRSMKKKGFVLILLLYIWYFFYRDGSSLYSYYDFIKAVFFYMTGAFIKETEGENSVFSGSVGGLIFHVLLFLCAFFLCGYLMYDVIQDSTNGTSIIGNILFWTPNQVLNNILIPLTGLLLLLVGKIRFSSRLVNHIASCTFGVYLFHEYSYTRTFLWHNILKADVVQFKSSLFPLYILLDVAVIFLAGIILETIRVQLEKLFRKVGHQGRF